MSDAPVSASRNFTKARVLLESRGENRVAVKDFSFRPLTVRLLFGRRTLRREARAYARLEGVEGIPRCIGLEGPDRLVIEWIDGEPIGKWRGERLPHAVFDRAGRLLRAVHARGVAVSDLHGSNLLVTAGDRVFLIDFAQARIGSRPERPGALVRGLMRLDEHALARIRARHYGEPEPLAKGFFGAIYRAARRIKKRLPSLP